jgi:subtilisin family serine protease
MNKMLMPILGIIFLSTAIAGVVQAEPGSKLSGVMADALQKRTEKHLYIVRLKGDPVLTYEGNTAGIAATRLARGAKINARSANVRKYVQHLDRRHELVLSTVSSAADKVYSYRYAFNGFSARLTEKQARALENSGEVMQVWKDKLQKPQTNNTPDFLELTGSGNSWSQGYVGEDIVIGIIDTGIYPEHPSFADTRTPRDGDRGRYIPYDAPPASFKGAGCAFGNEEFNENDAPFECNNKLLKADFFVDAYGVDQILDDEFLSGRDSDGHGSHTASTAGGNYDVEAIINGEFLGGISGMAPRARIASYKICWAGPELEDNGCWYGDAMAAIDQAVADGVDVINYSIGGPETSFATPDSIAFLTASSAGVWVATSAGNAGPNPQTLGTPAGAPWVTSVGATQDDEVFHFPTALEVSAPDSLVGEYAGEEGIGGVTLASVGGVTSTVVPGTPADGCEALTNADAINGNIALIMRGTCYFINKYHNAAAAGAKAIVIYNDGANPGRMDPFPIFVDETATIPGIMIGFEDGDRINTAVADGETVIGTIAPGIPASLVDRIVGFSSRGPNGGAPDIIKPDLAAPGVQILAAETPFPNSGAIEEGSIAGQMFGDLSGTSMASPHVAGAFALLKEAHPDWSPAMGRSALMTTARADLKKSSGEDAADPFDIGAGHIVPGSAYDPGLVYDAGLVHYLAFSCGNNVQLVDDETCAFFQSQGTSSDGSDLNLPSIGIADLVASQTITRTVTQMPGGSPSRRFGLRYTVSVDMPAGVAVTVSPSLIQLRDGESATYQVTFTSTGDALLDEWLFGSLTWSDGRHSVRSPIALKPAGLSAPTQISGSGAAGSQAFDVTFGYSGSFAAGMNGLTAAVESANSIEDGAVNQSDAFVIPEGATLARFSLFDADVGDGSGLDDLDIEVYGPESEGFPFVDYSYQNGSEEEVTIVNPQPGLYVVVVYDFATAEGPTAYTVYNFNLPGADLGNSVISAPAAAVFGGTGSVGVDWSELAPSRYLGIINYSKGETVLGAQTEVSIDAR